MSVRLMERVWELRLPATEKFVLLALADHANADGSNCYPSIPTLMEKTGLSRRCVQQTIRRLEKTGLLVLVARSRGDRAAEYLIDLGGKSDVKGAHQMRPLGRRRGASDDAKGAHLTTKRGASDDQIRERILIEPKPEPTSEPSYVPSGVVTETFPRNPADAVAVGSVLSVDRDVPVSNSFTRDHRHPPYTATAKSDDDDAARDNSPAQSNSGKPNPARADDAIASEKARVAKLRATALRIFEAKHPGEYGRAFLEAALDVIEVRAQGRSISSAAYFVTALERERAEIGRDDPATNDPEPQRAETFCAVCDHNKFFHGLKIENKLRAERTWVEHEFTEAVPESHENTEAPTEETWWGTLSWMPRTYGDIEELIFYAKPPSPSADAETFIRARNRAHRKAVQFKNKTGEFRSLEKCREFIEMLQRVSTRELGDNARRARMRARRAARKAVHHQSAPRESGELIH